MPSSSLLYLAGLLSLAAAQVYVPGSRPEGSFTWVQPRNTTVLGQYGHSEPFYPSPRTTGAGGWENAIEKAREFVAELTLEEKRYMVTGQPGPCVGNIYPIPRLNFSGLCLQDGPASLRTADYVSAFPAGVTIASSWDKQMMYDRSLSMGREFRAKGAQVALAPALGPMGRSAYSGRNWEGFSPDAYLSGIAFAQSIHGLQDAGVQATAKHYLLNEQEVLRNPVRYPNGTLQFEAISSNADDRTVHENYLWPYANAIRAKASAVMCSYNRVNGSYGCQNSKLLNGLLKEELGFQGYVMSDWFATHSGVASIEAGLDMDMPGYFLPRAFSDSGDDYLSFFGANVTQAINNGTLEMDRLDDMITRILTPYYALGQDEDFPTIDPSSAKLNTFVRESDYFRDFNLIGPSSRDVRDNHGEIIRKHAAASTVMVKNEGILPLKAPKRIAVFGNDAGEVTEGPLNQQKFEFGTLAVGGGSGASLFTYLITPLEAIKARSRQDGALVQAFLNNTQVVNSNVTNLWNPQEPEVCLVFLKGWASEGSDRLTLDLDWQGNELVEKVANVCSDTVVVTHSSGVNNLPFAQHPNVTAILIAHYPGQESGNSIVDVLYGDVNPSGKLPYTIAHNGSDYNGPITTDVETTGVDDWQSYFTEGLETDYKYFDAHNISVLYEFGFGLSYTTFEMTGLEISPVDTDTEITPAPEKREVQPGGNPALWETLYTARVTLRNTGDVRGATVAQLYITLPDSAPEGSPVRQLRGFDKIELSPGQRGTVQFDLMRRDISYWDVVSQQWLIPSGEFTVRVGFSSRDIVEVATFTAVEN
ncbi:putative beta-glucosidase [Stachybotrys elegans]|uniref:Beta-glucosidase cel3A n=1 Tax=Stachybotrys elegans TaxID=80388 RepID=A0A8K0SIN6_9HYPO|nr:putative beta-glucosidase [Stachybotrys elegans]